MLCFSVVSELFQRCFSSCFSVVSALFQRCFSRCFSVVSELFQRCFSVVSGCFSVVSALFQRCFRVVSALFQSCFSVVLFFSAVSTHVEGEERIQVLLMVEGGRTVYIHGFNKVDFALWHSAIKLASGTDGRALSNQQLSKKGVPIVVDSCIAFVTQYGLCHQGIYSVSGDPGRVSLLLGAFRQDARNVKLHVLEHQLEDVADTLKTFLSQAEDALLTKELYPYWVSALDEEDEKRRVEKYSRFIQSLPKINRSTLTALLQHLYR
ncbi:unnamed protein product [Oncorhynchus mykiss]|uniref:Rho-GAP domain-containing protein n=1 Tax=Oncorhynchus mykiss TaxID=8022 RepID=A0A060Y9A1_ONCMY|nr:unnamed protein product [Oncorhynchus mykiss]